MEQCERDKFRKEWDQLNKLRKSTKRDDIKEACDKRMKQLERMLTVRSADGIEAAFKATSVIAVTVSVFEDTSGYRGTTTHGTALGDGCYWNRMGHY